MDRILLSTRSRGQQRELSQALAGEYTVSSADSLDTDDGDDIEADLWILDLHALRDIGPETIRVYKQQEPEVASPVLLVAPYSQLEELDPSLWSLIDEVIGTPIRQAEFDGRVQSLIRMRRYAEEAEAARSRVEPSYGGVLRGVPNPVFVADADTGRIVDANGAAASLLGTSVDEIVGRGITTFHPEGAAEKTRVLVKKSLSSDEGAHEMLRRYADGSQMYLVTESGCRVPVEGSFSSVHVQGRTYITGIFRDITEQKQREDHLERQRDLFLKTQELADIGAWEYDVEHEALTWTEQVYTIHEVPVGTSMTAQGAIEFYHPEDRSTVREAFRCAIEEGERYNVDVRIITAEGTERWVRAHGEPQTREGEVIRVRGTLQDITNQKRWERKLRDAKEEAEETGELFRSIVDNTPVMINIVDEDGRIEMINNHFEEVLGWSQEELEEKEVSELWTLFFPEFEERQKVLKEMKEVTERWADFRPRTKDGTPIETTWTNVELSGGRSLGIGLDITERKRREDSLREVKEEAQEASQFKSSMLANMSHEVRTPLTSICGFADLLHEELEGDLREFAERIRRSSNRLMQTLTSILELSKLESGDYELERDQVDLVHLVEETTEMLSLQAEAKSIEVEVTRPEDHVQGRWNESTLTRMVENLLENAIKFTPEGGQVEARIGQENGEAILNVEDSGIGIGEEVGSEIFNAFKQESEGLDRVYEGTGLGLSIVKQIVEAHGGTIRVETNKGDGVCFTVRIPTDRSL